MERVYADGVVLIAMVVICITLFVGRSELRSVRKKTGKIRAVNDLLRFGQTAATVDEQP